MANIKDGFYDFYNEFKEWTKKQILHRTYDICLENADKDKEIERLNNIIDELKWKPISEYENPKYDWVLIKMFIKEDDFECVPLVAENRFGVWQTKDGEIFDEDMFEIKYFMDMQQLDKLKALKEGKE